MEREYWYLNLKNEYREVTADFPEKRKYGIFKRGELHADSTPRYGKQITVFYNSHAQDVLVEKLLTTLALRNALTHHYNENFVRKM